MAEGLTYDELPVGIRQKGDVYELGVSVPPDGAFMVFGQFKAGGFDAELASARDEAQAQPPAPPAEQ